jgi:transposase
MADGAEARASRQRIAFEELLEGIRQESERMERLEGAIREVVPEWSLAEVVPALKRN